MTCSYYLYIEQLSDMWFCSYMSCIYTELLLRLLFMVATLFIREVLTIYTQIKANGVHG